MLRILSTLLCAALFATGLTAQHSLFEFVAGDGVSPAVWDELSSEISDYQPLHLQTSAIAATLREAPVEGAPAAGRAPVYLDVPSPAGEIIRYRIVESSLFHPDLAARYPNIKNYRAFGPDGKVGRIGVSLRGIMAYLPSPAGTFTISPAELGNATDHLVYYRRNLRVPESEQGKPSCGYDEEIEEDLLLSGLELDPGVSAAPPATGNGRSNQAPIIMREYDLALGCTGEFGASIGGGTKEGVLAAFNESLTILNSVFEQELAVRMRIIPQSDSIIFLVPSFDPFINADEGGELLGQIASAFTNAGVPPVLYDLGHLFTRGCNDVGGQVSGRACTPGKMRGVTCVSGTVAGATTRILTHEIGHQFAVAHSWDRCPPSEEQRAGSSAYEPGSGTTIMSYAGTCGQQNIQFSDDTYYHTHSLEQFITYSRESTADGCATKIATSNTEPTITMPYQSGFTIPISTPFELDASATDLEGDPMTYNWEQYDLGPGSNLGEPIGNAPIFRSYFPDENTNRVFPRIDRVVSGNNSVTELLPTYSRDLTFRFTVRDNNTEAGAAVWGQVAFKATAAAGPFRVTTAQSPGITWTAGEYREVNWDVANTDVAPVNCYRVNIRLSLDGGFTYPITLLEGAANNGSAFVTVPDLGADNENQVRIRVDAADNVFFNISDRNLTIRPAEEATFALTTDVAYQRLCLPDDATVTIGSESFLGFDENFSLEIVGDLPDGATAEFTETELAPGETTQLNLSFQDLNFDDTYQLVIRAVAEGGTTVIRNIDLDLFSSDFTDLTLVSPSEGQTDIILIADLDWTEAANAERYNLQLATSPSFSPESIVQQVMDTVATSFTPNEFFEPNTLYFWRVQGVNNNECGAGEWADPASFRTVASTCVEYDPTDLPVSLPPNGPPITKTSEVFVVESGIISDINIPNILINYQFIKELTLTLVSPAGTRVKLFDQQCFSTQNFNIGFDDEAPLDIVCPPDDARVFRPIEELSAFNGENTQGLWKLEVLVTETGGAVGSLQDWSIEFCSTADLTPPVLIRNNEMELETGESVLLDAYYIYAEDETTAFVDLIVTLVRAPRHGRLITTGGTEVMAGMSFSQGFLFSQSLFYEHDGQRETVSDDFLFIIEDEEGGYIPITPFRIEVFPGAVTGTEDDPTRSETLELTVFPNPADDQLTVNLSRNPKSDLPLELFDLTGRRLLQATFAAGRPSARLDVSRLRGGIYLMRVADRTVRVVVK
ncbi:MAG: reprolysin-like metallopeptidase [Saprospiraceae bacterium]